MIDDRADAAWAAAVASDVASLEREGLDDVLVAVRLARSRLDAIEMRVARRLRQLSDEGRSDAPQRAIASATGKTQRDALDVAARDELCVERPDLEGALDRGELTAAHLDAVHGAARNLVGPVREEYLGHTDDLLRRASRVSLETFRRECRALAKHCASAPGCDPDVDELEQQRAASRVSRWVDPITGMHHTRLELDPVRDAKLGASINRELARLRATQGAAQRPWQQLLVDAALHALTGGGGSRPDGGVGADSIGVGAQRGAVVDRVPEITVVVDFEALTDAGRRHGLRETENGVDLPVATVRRMCCDAEIVPVVMGGGAEVLDVGRSERTATRAQRRALRALYRTCAHPECGVGFDACRIHHVEHWLEHRGPTDLSNLLPLCETHHHQVHEGRWGLRVDADRVGTWTRPDGVRHMVESTVNRTACPLPGEPPPRTAPTRRGSARSLDGDVHAGEGVGGDELAMV
ncbi:HNH endonuclease [Ilumatobacter sp.]